MLGKLLKYDLRSMLKTISLFWAAALVLALVNHFTMNSLNFESSNFLIDAFLHFIPLLLYIGIMIAMGVLTLLIVIQRFYNGLLKDEGYLMFTLPVKPWQLITSKGLSAVIVSFISGLVAVLSIFVLAPWDMFDENAKEMLRTILSFDGQLQVWQTVVILISALLAILVNIAKSNYQIYAAIALGHQFKTHRVAMAFVMYMLLSVALSTLATSILQAIHIEDLDTLVVRLFDTGVFGTVTAGIWVVFLIGAVQLVIFHVITERLLAKRLNLE